MTVDAFLAQLEEVRPRGAGRWTARCPAHHPDRHPSLSVREGERGLLIKCWTGCGVEDITTALGLAVKDLFYKAHADPKAVREARRRREKRDALQHVQGLGVDTRREAEALIKSARNPGLAGWDEAQYDQVMNLVGDAYQILLTEKMEHGEYPF